MYKETEERFEGFGLDAVGGFFFLRFVCPAIVAPHLDSVIDSACGDMEQSSVG